jgi:N-acetylglutamate synthase-like GNAT family acetyltransferase
MTTTEPLEIAAGTLADYNALADLHYRAGKPATATQVWTWRGARPTVIGRYLRRPAQRQVVAVLVVSLPSLSCAVRDQATAGRYRNLPPRSRAMMLNDELRTISRVVVHPQYRGLGLARSLVEHALAQARTPYTEALAAMGQVHPFFEQAGMTRYDRGPHPHDARLSDALQAVDLDATQLVDTRTVRQRITALPAAQRCFITRELTRWYRLALRRPAAELDTILTAARQRLLFVPVYYLWRQNTAALQKSS